MTPQHSHLLYELNIYDNSNKNSSVSNDESDNSNNTNNKRNPNMIRIMDNRCGKHRPSNQNDANSNGNGGSHNTNGSKNSNYSNSRNVSIRKILMIMIGMIAAKSFALT